MAPSSSSILLSRLERSKKPPEFGDAVAEAGQFLDLVVVHRAVP
jgi:hypothetical protein